jgi:methylthioribose-1-phosphate isomerase
MARHGIPHTLFVDSASGLLLARASIDLVIVGADRVARNGDVCNKIGTYDKALAARDNGVPFYVALPSPTIDWSLASGEAIPIESRGEAEVLRVPGVDEAGRAGSVAIAPAATRAVNFAFDVTRAALVDGYLTERGLARSPAALANLFPERAQAPLAA